MNETKRRQSGQMESPLDSPLDQLLAAAASEPGKVSKTTMNYSRHMPYLVDWKAERHDVLKIMLEGLYMAIKQADLDVSLAVTWASELKSWSGVNDGLLSRKVRAVLADIFYRLALVHGMEPEASIEFRDMFGTVTW